MQSLKTILRSDGVVEFKGLLQASKFQIMFIFDMLVILVFLIRILCTAIECNRLVECIHHSLLGWKRNYVDATTGVDRAVNVRPEVITAFDTKVKECENMKRCQMLKLFGVELTWHFFAVKISIFAVLLLRQANDYAPLLLKGACAQMVQFQPATAESAGDVFIRYFDRLEHVSVASMSDGGVAKIDDECVSFTASGSGTVDASEGGIAEVLVKNMTERVFSKVVEAGACSRKSNTLLQQVPPDVPGSTAALRKAHILLLVIQGLISEAWSAVGEDAPNYTSPEVHDLNQTLGEAILGAQGAEVRLQNGNFEEALKAVEAVSSYVFALFKEVRAAFPYLEQGITKLLEMQVRALGITGHGNLGIIEQVCLPFTDMADTKNEELAQRRRLSSKTEDEETSVDAANQILVAEVRAWIHEGASFQDIVAALLLYERDVRRDIDNVAYLATHRLQLSTLQTLWEVAPAPAQYTIEM